MFLCCSLRLVNLPSTVKPLHVSDPLYIFIAILYNFLKFLIESREFSLRRRAHITELIAHSSLDQLLTRVGSKSSVKAWLPLQMELDRTS
jgi:hypothetical protein